MFPASRAEGLKRLTAFVPKAGTHYAANRNSDLGPEDRKGVSVLSPYIRHRMIAEDEVVAAVLKQHRFSAAEKYVQEVLWRTYWKGWLEMRPAVWTRYLEELDLAQQNAGRNRDLEKALSGATGIEGFDDWVHELKQTGYLHNHARMWFASIWIFTLRLPWVLGADFFMSHLIDADPASNTLSWRWVAGLQTVGKTYLATTDNIARYTGGRFAPTGLATHATALIEPPIPAAGPVREPGDRVPVKGALLLLTGEDLSPETVLSPGDEVADVVAAVGTATSPYGEISCAFLKGASEDALQRCVQHYKCSTSSIESLSAQSLIAAADRADTRTIVTPFAPVGPVADAFVEIRPNLAAAGITLVERRRDWDSQFWPHAKKGFFPFKEKIPVELATLGLV
jgi:deoxyribodipyrimidine photo-lyase